MRFIILFFIISTNFLVSFSSYASDSSSFRVGIMKHDLKSDLSHRHEKGYNINASYIFSKNYEFLYARPHIGISFNSNPNKYTSFIYSGLTWRLVLKDLFFLELDFGGSINNGNRKKTSTKRAIGSNLLFRESFSAGIQIGNTHSVSAMIEHVSNANIVKPNPGFTNFGIKYGYDF